MNKKILIVDDERDLVDLIVLRMKAEGFETLTAFDGDEALAQAIKMHPGLILLDVMMPNVNGYQVARELKKNEATKDIKIVMLTAKVGEQDRFWGMESGADEYVTKPFEMPFLVALIRKMMG